MIHKNTVLRRLVGPANLKARRFYSNLKTHYHTAKCPICSFYQRYGVLIIHGNLFEHMHDINEGQFLAPDDFYKLRDAKLIELDEISPNRHRITIAEFAP